MTAILQALVSASGSRPCDPGAAALAALQALPAPVAVLGHDHGVLLCNPAFDAVFAPDGAGLGAALERGMLPDGRRVRVVPLDQGVLVTVEPDETDPITGLAAASVLRARLAAALAGGRRDVAVLALDLARFKAVNDALGRPIGDALLRRVADRIRSALAPADLAARGEAGEFLVLRHGDRPGAEALARRLADLIGRSYLVEGELIDIGACIGVAPAAGADAEAVLRQAALALAQARQGGGPCTFDDGMSARVRARRALELDLRRALALREFALVYQPQVNLYSDRVTGFEALLRWHHPERGMVPPSDFVPLAEEIGAIVPIGEWVLRTACRDAAGWSHPLTVAVNVSAVQFAQGGFVAAVLSALGESGLDPRRLELEITESVLLGDREAVLSALHRLRAMGVRVSMDDFGTGYSSLSYLHSFPFEKIKIDQSFVRGEDAERSGLAIVRAIAALGRSLGMTTTAEGVETEAQRRRIAAEGCTDMQGYLIARPLPAGEVETFLQGRDAARCDPGFHP